MHRPKKSSFILFHPFRINHIANQCEQLDTQISHHIQPFSALSNDFENDCNMVTIKWLKYDHLRSQSTVYPRNPNIHSCLNNDP